MRRHQQRQIFQLLEIIKEAQSGGFYADCQEGALAVGEFIEAVTGGGTRTVALLEEYCDLVYMASNGEIGEKALRSHIVSIENSVKSELKPNRIEIVFLSYKASMSDSIESIYLAAKEDPDCDAFWIPISYCEREADGSLGAMRFDGAECYGDNIHCTDWREYDVAARHPDVIFTFNPYDTGNYVTSVHPDYYCERLRGLTDMLVYVPYFVVANDVLDAYCTVPGCIFAHKVIVQSVKVRDTYIRVFGETYGDRFGRRKDKFIALGSPKFDKVVTSKRDDFNLPDEWRKLIGNKKTIFYNTTVSAILADDSRYLEKLRDVINTLRKRNDVALWWRPHPLNESTFASMRPKLLKEYRRIVEEFRRDGWGIYDDTPDLHRAIACTDAYYGDGSSLVAMYEATGKPVMISDPNVLQDEIECSPVCVYVHNETIWMSDMRINALFKMSAERWEPVFAGSFPEEKEYLRENYFPLYLRPALLDGRLYFPPFSAKQIAIYSIEDNAFEKVRYKTTEDTTNDGGDFSEAIAYGNYIYFIPRRYPAIIRLDTVTKELSYHSDWVEALEKLIGNVWDVYFFFPLSVGRTVMLAACGTNVVVEFDMEACTSIIHEVGKSGYRYSGICFDGECYWLSPRNNTPLVKWNPTTGETKEFIQLHTEDKGMQSSFLPCVFCFGYVWLLPMMADHAIKIDVSTDIISIAHEFEFEYQDESEHLGFKYLFAQVFENSIFAYNEKNGVLVEYNCETKRCRKEKIKYTSEALPHIEALVAKSFLDSSDAVLPENSRYYESKLSRLWDFVNYLVLYGDNAESKSMENRRADITRSINAHSDGTSGAAIHTYIRGICG